MTGVDYYFSSVSVVGHMTHRSFHKAHSRIDMASEDAVGGLFYSGTFGCTEGRMEGVPPFWIRTKEAGCGSKTEVGLCGRSIGGSWGVKMVCKSNGTKRRMSAEKSKQAAKIEVLKH